MDIVQTIGIIAIVILLAYVIVKLERAVTKASKRLNGLLVEQQTIVASMDRQWRRIEAIEQDSMPRSMIIDKMETLDVRGQRNVQRLDAIEARLGNKDG